MEALGATLSAEEQVRAARFQRPLDRSRYIAGRGQLRRLLGGYTGLTPEQLRFISGPKGKPELASECNPDSLQFNLAHSGGMALYAVAWRRRVGVDLERIRADVEIETLAARFFTPEEAESLRSLPASQRTGAFFTCWTRKEAYLKARGDGITFGLERFAVSLLPDAPPALLRAPFDPAEVDRWTLHALDVGSDYAAALAVEGKERPTVSFFPPE